MTVSFNMSNAELADAITAAYNRSGTGSPSQQLHTKQLETLLAIQKQRALSVTIAGEPGDTITETDGMHAQKIRAGWAGNGR